MPIFAQLTFAAEARGLRFLVIGGHAVIRHGFMRATADADLLVSRDERAQWEEMARGLGYDLFHDGGTFLQWSPAGGRGWELDMMLVPATTFDQMFAEARSTQMEGTTVLIPSLDHLFALKFHALRNASGLRVLRDMEDVIQLAKANRVDVRGASFRELAEKYGTAEIYERILKACAG